MSTFPYEMKQKNGLLTYPPPPTPFFSFPSPYDSKSNEEKSTPPSSFTRISPVLLWTIVTLAAVFFISGLIHLFIRYLIKKRSAFSIIHHSNRYPDTTRSQSLQSQLQQLFHLHDSGLDQASIDSLPVFDYRNITGLKEQLDCAVCLSEFSFQNKLRLLPMCGHAFHIDCIGTWLLSNSTCPLCRASLLGSGLPMETPLPHFHELPGHVESGPSVTMEESGEAEKRVFPVRLGRLRSSDEQQIEGEREQGEVNITGNLDSRRCYSMGSYQYVVGDSNLQVALPDVEGKRIGGRSRGESLSVSKVWLWSKRSKAPSSSDTPMWVPCNASSYLPSGDTS